VTAPRLLLILTENWTMRPPPDVGDLVDFDQALAGIPAQLARGFRTICVKPSQFTDDPARIGDFCRELVAKVSTLA
jgi:hypothetical protein